MKSRGKLIFLYIGLFLQSCNSIQKQRMLSHPIRDTDIERDLGQADSPLIIELRSKIQRLARNGFILQGNNLRNHSMREDLMFVFYHSLRFKRPGVPFFNQNERDRFVNLFIQNDGFRTLVWDVIRVDRPSSNIPQRRYMVEFRLKDLFKNTHRSLQGNMARAQEGTAPDYLYNDGIETVDVDHLFRDNSITIELPRTLHQDKTLDIDNLMDRNEERVIRDAAGHWKKRYRDFKVKIGSVR